ncbi:DNA polymerase kappa [Aphelenchoides bicaudatus]|nr:DNA polymerase kappa [Aphelenchoides bicaudatus]
MARVYENLKAGMAETDKQKISEVIEKSTNDNYRAHMREQKEHYDQKLAIMKNEMSKMNRLEYFEAQSGSDEYIFSIDNERKLDYVFVHFDMDAFFANVEARDDPKLRDIPFAVGNEQMISTSNYLARKFGVRSAMPGYIGVKLCKGLVFVQGNYSKYGEVAKVYREVFREYDSNFHYVGLDEATLNLTDFMKTRTEPVQLVGRRFGGDCKCFLPIWDDEAANKYPDGKSETNTCEKCKETQLIYTYNVTFGKSVEDVVNEIRFRVEQVTGGLTCSAGIAANYMLAKICSDINKPNGQFSLERNKEEIKKFVEKLNVRKIPGIGPSTEYLLNGMGWKTCLDVINNRMLVWHLFTSKQRRFLLRACTGISQSEIPWEANETSGPSRQSLSAARTFTDTRNRTYLNTRLRGLIDSVFETMFDDGHVGCKNIGVRIKTRKFKDHSKQETKLAYINSSDIAFMTASSLLDKLMEKDKESIRLIGVVLSDFTSNVSSMTKTMEQFFVPEAQLKKKTEPQPGPSTSIEKNSPSDDIIFEKNVKATKPKVTKSKVKPAPKKAKGKKKIDKNQGRVDSWLRLGTQQNSTSLKAGKSKGQGNASLNKSKSTSKRTSDVIILDSDDEIAN